jgi:uncharacterized protein
LLYLDSSALLKLIVDEPESDALEDYLQGDGAWVSSSVALVEMVRGTRRHRAVPVGEASSLVSRLELIAVDDVILRAAAELDPPALRSLDAIHIATALALGDELDALVTYDRRMQDAADSHGVEFAAPM